MKRIAVSLAALMMLSLLLAACNDDRPPPDPPAVEELPQGTTYSRLKNNTGPGAKVDITASARSTFIQYDNSGGKQFTFSADGVVTVKDKEDPVIGRKVVVVFLRLEEGIWVWKAEVEALTDEKGGFRASYLGDYYESRGDWRVRIVDDETEDWIVIPVLW